MVFFGAPMAKSRFTSYLGKALTGVTQVRVGKQAGLGQSTVSALLNGEKPPNYEHVVKLSAYLNVHPAVLFEAAGRPKDAEICRRMMPETWVAGPLASRFQRLMRLDMAGAVEEAFGRLELMWEANRGSFEISVKELGHRAACLVVYHMGQGEVLYRWNCSEQQAVRLAEGRKAGGWRRVEFKSGEMVLAYFASGGNLDEGRIDSILKGWSDVFNTVLSRK